MLDERYSGCDCNPILSDQIFELMSPQLALKLMEAGFCNSADFQKNTLSVIKSSALLSDAECEEISLALSSIVRRG